MRPILPPILLFTAVFVLSGCSQPPAPTTAGPLEVVINLPGMT